MDFLVLELIQPLNRNKYHGYLLKDKDSQCEWLTALRPSYANCLEILGASTSWSHVDLLGGKGGQCVYMETVSKQVRLA